MKAQPVLNKTNNSSIDVLVEHHVTMGYRVYVYVPDPPFFQFFEGLAPRLLLEHHATMGYNIEFMFMKRSPPCDQNVA